ncbi:MAG: hypothetical protein OXH15_10005 [Gammaproteobacteria bacterium]|nr:hypothetical protein [Gammaproteobacteria bacterium]
MRAANWLVLGATAAAVVAVLVLAPPGWIARAETVVAAWSGWLGAARIAAIAAAWVWWDALVGRLPGITADGAAHLRARRAFWIGALVAVELVLVRNVVGTLWAFVA